MQVDGTDWNVICEYGQCFLIEIQVVLLGECLVGKAIAANLDISRKKIFVFDDVWSVADRYPMGRIYAEQNYTELSARKSF